MIHEELINDTGGFEPGDIIRQSNRYFIVITDNGGYGKVRLFPDGAELYLFYSMFKSDPFSRVGRVSIPPLPVWVRHRKNGLWHLKIGDGIADDYDFHTACVVDTHFLACGKVVRTRKHERNEYLQTPNGKVCRKCGLYFPKKEFPSVPYHKCHKNSKRLIGGVCINLGVFGSRGLCSIDNSVCGPYFDYLCDLYKPF
jgi:hypothetical protein